jgi:hypothetical protein
MPYASGKAMYRCLESANGKSKPIQSMAKIKTHDLVRRKKEGAA